jgi:RimJ/RimL family protein N-acetyltransferase
MSDLPEANGRSVWLRAAETHDFEVIRTIREDTPSQDLLMAYPHHQRADALLWFNAKVADNTTPFLSVCLGGSTCDACAPVVGYVQFAHLHHAGRNASFGLAIAPSRRGHNLGRAATRAALEYAHERLSLRKLLLEVRADNAAAIKIYTDEGFRFVGTLHGHYDDGTRLHDVILMEIVLEEALA